MLKKITSILTAAAFALGTATATPVRADNDAAKIIGGLVVGGLIGAAIANDNNNRGHDDRHVTRGYRDDHYVGQGRGYRREHNNGYRHDNGYRNDKRVNLPGACRVYKGHRSGYSGHCLREHAYGRASLPSACAVRVGGHHREIYRDRCLNQYGYY